MRRSLLSAALLLSPNWARATDCVFYLKRSSAGVFQGRTYSPGLQRDRAAGPAGMAEPEVLWDGRFHHVYWLADGKIHRASWKEASKRFRPVTIPEELSSRAGWRVQDGRLQLAAFKHGGKALERWEYRAADKTWMRLGRERFLDQERPVAEQGAKAVFSWSERRTDWPLEARLERMRGSALMGPHVRWEGTRESNQGFWSFFHQTSCGLKIQVQRDEAGAHVVAPLVHWCDRPETPRKERRPGYPEPELEPLKGKVLYDSPERADFAPLAFEESGAFLLVGREADMSGAVLFRQKDGGAAKRFAPEASRAVWVPCPAAL